MNEPRCYAKAGAGRPSAPRKGGSPEKKARPALARAPRPEGGSGSYRRLRRPNGFGGCARSNDLEPARSSVPPGSVRHAIASKAAAGVFRLAAIGATAKGRARASNNSSAGENSRLGF